ncbi:MULTISPECIES: DUF2797 domain-containing protein [Thermoactinomyces]|uniref:DUF2797 domain-containing protein n=1 Tax=Thermoactinomyces daqus TaxID=1329516 RepID=A0A7W1XA47_9BACL|nr:DUF2797 domain-containing protein [Thermoactinomyces daqus]MBA4542799.1 DUF2797 domain-containing protein [Thermoactinomyces daqus]MBH8598528.1 DUF2797 domain-containing protein [Thermoactinomyces sp. CICC 10523]MBH8604628.1 DUF2797 domain-containing protein [Thermoactinomyces sp. CICC 10522]
MKKIGILRPLVHQGAAPVEYALQLDDQEIGLNARLGQEVQITFLGERNCIFCGRKTKKFYGNNSSCFNCFRKLPDNDICIVRPERCHFHEGTCRDPEFGRHHCMQPHIVYLALSSDVKVGITRKTNRLKRWVDQGAVAALPLMEVPTRKDAGEIEVFLSQYITDKTNWRKMLKNETADIDLLQTRADLIEKLPDAYRRYLIEEPQVLQFDYPHIGTPTKITSFNLEKQETISGKLIGVKAQYLILDNGVFGVRKHAGFKVALEF